MKKLCLPKNVKDINDIMEVNPAIKKVAKYYNDKDFIPLEFVVFSQPQTHADVIIYGRFVIVKKNVRKNMSNLESEPEIKQDFIAYNRFTKTAVYYSGVTKKNKKKHECIHSFCREYGKWPDGSWGQYECSKDLKTKHHWYKDETDEKLPKEYFIREEISKKIKAFREVVVADIIKPESEK